MARPPLVVFDFDWSLINCNSDTLVVEQLGGAELMRSLRPTLPWTELMDRMLGEIMARGNTVADVERCLKTIPLHSAMTRCIRAVAVAGCDLQIISDANTFFIRTVLDNFGIAKHFSRVHSNSARLDERGVFRVEPYQPAERPHGCPLCPPNMCKGLILDGVRSTSDYPLVVFVGDGNGDYCPALRLKETDHVLAREEFPLARRLEAEPQLLRARLHKWSCPKGIESSLAQILPTLN